MKTCQMSTFLLLEVSIKAATVSRGKKCSAFMSFSALLRAHSLAVVQWRSQTNYTLFNKSKLYKNTQAEICPKINNKLRTITRLKF